MQDSDDRENRPWDEQLPDGPKVQTARPSEVRLVSVNVGLPQVIGATRWGKPIQQRYRQAAGDCRYDLP